MNYNFDSIFPSYNQFQPSVPVWCVTSEIEGAFHRFFDTSPISPSGRYLALTRLLNEKKLPEPGDKAEILLIDLKTGKKKIIAETNGFDTQLGAQAQWGKEDEELFYNDLNTDNWEPFGVKMNPITGKKQKLEGTIYMVSPDGKYSISPCLRRIIRTQAGYGVIVPQNKIPINNGAPDNDGIYITDNEKGKKELLVSLKKIVKVTKLKETLKKYGKGDFYGFHVKWNKQGNKIMLVLRYKTKEGNYIPQLITMNSDGSNIKIAIPASEWGEKGGHHPNWCPDGKNVMMNLRIYEDEMRFVKARFDGSNYRTITDSIIGSGHPSLHNSNEYIITDSYLREPFAYKDGTTPIRLINLKNDTDKEIIRIRTKPSYNVPGNELRVDPHPAWGPFYKFIVFNACPEGKRKVFIADLSKFIK